MQQPLWQATSASIWQGRDDSKESALARRIFQTIHIAHMFDPQAYPQKLALLGFMSDEGVRLNQGRVGAKSAPDLIRCALANMAAHPHDQLVDMGNISCPADQLPAAQALFSQHIHLCHRHQLKTLVFGGGHETAYAHGLGLYYTYPDARIGIINLDAHLDLRVADYASSGTPFMQLAQYCAETQRPFDYLCIGASMPANTQALLKTAADLQVGIIWDADCTERNLKHIESQVQSFIDQHDLIYLTIDLDVLSCTQMFAVSAPASLGIELRTLLHLIQFIGMSPKLKAVDLVEYNPDLDIDSLCAKVAARIAWHLSQTMSAG